MKNTKHKTKAHMAKIQMPTDLWAWIKSHTEISATKFVVDSLQGIREGSMIPKTVSDDIIRTKEAEVRGAIQMAKGVIEADRPKSAGGQESVRTG
jgi:hypothetical protein